MADTNVDVPDTKLDSNAMSFDFKEQGSAIAGLDRLAYVGARMRDAVKSPEKYFEDRLKAINGIRKAARDKFNEKFNAYRKQLYSVEESKSMA